MKLLILLLVLVLFVTGCAAAEGNEEDRPEELLSQMTTREKMAQMMLPSFRVWKEVPETAEGQETAEETPEVNVTELNGDIRAMLARDRFGGVVLFAQNFADEEQTLRLVADMQEANREGGGIPLLLFADQEGGYANRIPFSTQGVGNMALGAAGDPESARDMAEIHGEEMRLLGIHGDFAPVMDVNSDATNPIIGVRSFSDDPGTVAELGCAWMAGLHDAGVIASLKHFPGHGDTDTDSHTGFPLIGSTYEELKQCELIPFQAGIDAGADLVMTAHIQFPEIEKETSISVSTGEEVYLPATMSRTILTDILRGNMGFDGVIVSDALDMRAVSDNFSVEDTLKRTINAGVDLLILPCVFDTNQFRMTETWLDTAVALAERGEIEGSRIDDAVLRILKLKEKYGLLDLTDFTVTKEQAAEVRDAVGSDAHMETERQIAEKALTLLKNEGGAFPVRMQAGEKALVLFADSCASRAGAGDLSRKLLEEKNALPEGAEILVMKNTKENADECVQAALDADHVVLVHREYSAACLDPATEDGFSTAAFDRIIEALHEKGRSVILVSGQLPYDAARFPDADAILLAYWSGAMQELPAEGTPWSQNLPLALCAAFGEGIPGGSLPVDIPALDGQYRPAGEILWPRGTKADQ